MKLSDGYYPRYNHKNYHEHCIIFIKNNDEIKLGTLMKYRNWKEKLKVITKGRGIINVINV